MNSLYVYIVAIIIILLVLLFVYNVIANMPPAGATAPSPIAPTAILSITYGQITTAPFTVTISSGSLSNTITSGSATRTPITSQDFIVSAGATQFIGGINYDGSSYLNFYKYLNNSTNQSKFALRSPSDYNITIKDTSPFVNSNPVMYDATTSVVSAGENTLTFTATTGTLTITFVNPFK